MQAKDLLIEKAQEPKKSKEEEPKRRLSFGSKLVLVCAFLLMVFAVILLQITIVYNQMLQVMDTYEAEHAPQGYCIILDMENNAAGLYYNDVVLGHFKQPMPDDAEHGTLSYNTLLDNGIVLDPLVLEALHLYDFPKDSLVIII